MGGARVLGGAAVAAAALAGAAEARQEGNSVLVRATIRDFLPAPCMRESVFQADWETEQWNGVPEASFYNVPIEEVNLDQKPEGFQGRDATVEVFCPYFSFMHSGVISGHPDFEADSAVYNNGPPCTFGCDSSVVALIDAVVKPTLGPLNQAGLRKPQYCKDEPGGRCGQRLPSDDDTDETVRLFTTSRKKNFDTWFNDEKKFNKRVGHTLNLKFDNALQTFVYDAEDEAKVENDGKHPFFSPLGDLSTSVNEADWPNPLDAPAWPNSLRTKSDASHDYRRRSLFFTTEIHTSFSFKGDEVFKFKGDDDVWVYINGRLAVDLGGLHPSHLGVVDLKDEATRNRLGLVVGQTYAFDMFHAERHFDASNFRIETTLTEGCNVVTSGSVAFDSNANDATEDKYFVTGGANVRANERALRLTARQGVPASPSAVFLKTQANLGTGFTFEFSFNLGDVGKSEGFAVVFHNRREGLDNLPFSIGGHLNFRFIERSIALVVDLCADRASGDGCEKQEIRLHYPKNIADSNNAGPETLTVFDQVARSLRLKNEVHTIRIESLVDPDWIDVYLDDSLYLRQENFDIQKILGGRNAYVGFTSATSNDPVRLDIKDILLRTVEVEPAKTAGPGDDFVPPVLPADGDSFAGVEIKTFDLCSNPIQFGGFASLGSAVFVENINLDALNRRLRGLQGDEDEELPTPYYNGSSTPTVISAEMIDQNDGSYLAALRTDIPASFSVHVCYNNGGCNFDVTLEDIDRNQFPGAPEGLKVAKVTGSPAAFTFTLEEAVVAIPLTGRPTVSPTTFTAPEDPDDGPVVAAAIGGGGTFLLFVIIAAVMAMNRRKWRRDKAFIEAGRLYNIDRELTYNKTDEYNQVGRQLVSTRAEIMRERAQTVKLPKKDEINQLVNENEELKEQVRLNKMNTQVSVGTGSYHQSFANTGARPKRKEFQVPDSE